VEKMVTTRSSGIKPTTSVLENVSWKRTGKRKKPTTSKEHVEPLPSLLQNVQLYTQGLEEKAPSLLLSPQQTKVSLSLWDAFEISNVASFSSSESEDPSKLYLCYTGGEVWACDTLRVHSKLYLALSAYRKDSLLHSIYEKYSNPGLIQVWELDICNFDKPVCILCIGHQGDFCRQLRWLPVGESVQNNNQSILGFLLGCFGDGTLKVLRVKYDAGWKQKHPDLPIFVPSDVIFSFSCPNDANLVVTECSPDGRWIIGGDTKGTLHLWNIKESQNNAFIDQQQSNHIYYQSFPAHQVTIRSLATPRTLSESSCIHFSSKNSSVAANELVASGSMDGCVRIWMLHYPYRPLLEYRLGQSWIYQLEWHSTKELVAALDDGSVRLLPIEDAEKSTRVLALHQGACWCVSVSESRNKPYLSISSGGENGEWIYCNDSYLTYRKSKKHACHPRRLAKLEVYSDKLDEKGNEKKASSVSMDDNPIRYSLSTFICPHNHNIPETAQYMQRPLSSCVFFPPSIAFHRVFHHFLAKEEDLQDTQSYPMILGATFGNGWLLIGAMSSWLVEQL